MGHLGPPAISSGYWTNDSVFGAFDHHDAGLVEVRPGQGIASPSGAYEHGTGGHMGPPTISSGYWTNDSVFGTFDHHDAGLVEIRPGQGISSPSGAYEHGTAESRGGCGRG